MTKKDDPKWHDGTSDGRIRSGPATRTKQAFFVWAMMSQLNGSMTSNGLLLVSREYSSSHLAQKQASHQINERKKDYL
jgi:hypothetical protein